MEPSGYPGPCATQVLVGHLVHLAGPHSERGEVTGHEEVELPALASSREEPAAPRPWPPHLSQAAAASWARPGADPDGLRRLKPPPGCLLLHQGTLSIHAASCQGWSCGCWGEPGPRSLRSHPPSPQRQSPSPQRREPSWVQTSHLTRWVMLGNCSTSLGTLPHLSNRVCHSQFLC